jgi:GNAT superfamily N-acetyltransferase
MVGGEDELAWIFRWAEEHYQGVGARWSLWLAEHFLAPELMSRVAKLVKPYRLAAQHRSAGMVARDLSKPRRPLPEIELRRVAAGEDRWNLCYVMSQAFVTSMETYLDAYDRGEYWETGMKGLVGYRQGQAISSACYLPGRDAVGLYGVATLPAEQRKGYGEAMVRAALEAARRESGLEKAVLQASGQAAALYRRLGFRTVTFVSVYNEVV